MALLKSMLDWNETNEVQNKIKKEKRKNDTKHIHTTNTLNGRHMLFPKSA